MFLERLTNGIGGIVIAILACVACLAVEVMTVGMFLKAKAIEGWPTTNGVILSSELTSQFRGTSTSYEARIEYEYRVGEQPYKSNKVRTRGAAGQHHSDLAPLVEKFAAGRQIPVHYNPADPSEAYLETGVDFVNYIIIISPLFFAFVAAAYIVERLRQNQKSGASDTSQP